MGKVGSTSVYWALKNSGVYSVFHIHRLNPENNEKVKKYRQAINIQSSFGRINKKIFKQIIQKNKKILVITLVRDPINRNISAYFENIQQYILKHDIDHTNVATYTENFLNYYPHHVPLEWFDLEPKTVFGIDIYAHNFSIQQGYLIIKKDQIDWLIIKSELANNVKENILRNFLGIDDLLLTYENVSSNKPFATTYINFKNNTKLPTTYIDTMMNAKYTRYFYSREELSKLWSQWL
jgi:hypothetical protein